MPPTDPATQAAIDLHVASLVERLGIAIAGNVTRDAEIRQLRGKLATAELALLNVSKRLAREYDGDVEDEDFFGRCAVDSFREAGAL